MKTKITIICENRVPDGSGLKAEHGLSVLIESVDVTMLDTGQKNEIVHNMQVLGKDAKNINRLVLSHGHFDHAGGLMPLLEMRGDKLPVYLNKDAYIEKIALEGEDGNTIREIGFGYSIQEYTDKGAIFIHLKGNQRITDNIFSLSNIERQPGWKTWDKRLKIRVNGEIKDDPFDDDLSLLIETDSGPVVLLGCAHAGTVEILNAMSKETGYKKFRAVIGGTHLGTASEDYVRKTIDAFKKYGVETVAACHCTGEKACGILASEFKKEYAVACAGSVFEF